MKTPELDLPQGIEMHVGQTSGQAGQQLADTVAEHLRERLNHAPRASLAVSGGTTPLPFFRALSRKELDWSRVDVILADERWVDEADQASNTRLVKESLLQNQAAAARFLPVKQPGAVPEEGIAAAKAGLAGLARPLDVLVLGMGNDGHTASLFPDAPELRHGMNPESGTELAAMTPPSQAQPRITLTYAFMKQARFVALHLKGNDKLETLKRALKQPDDLLAMPVRGFLKPGLQIFWSP